VHLLAGHLEQVASLLERALSLDRRHLPGRGRGLRAHGGIS
jgi:hypothetical protein